MLGCFELITPVRNFACMIKHTNVIVLNCDINKMRELIKNLIKIFFDEIKICFHIR